MDECASSFESLQQRVVACRELYLEQLSVFNVLQLLLTKWLTVENYANWIASAATMIAAMMTAANLGARITGWGFVVFTIGSLMWAFVGFTSGQTSLFITNLFLFAVNVFGVWRWLGRQARLEQGSDVATQRSHAHDHVPTLFSTNGLIGAKVNACDSKMIGTVVDAMLARETNQLSYIVISQGGIGGAGETLRALRPAHFVIDTKVVRCVLTSEEVALIPAIDDAAWPAVAPEPQLTTSQS